MRSLQFLISNALWNGAKPNPLNLPNRAVSTSIAIYNQSANFATALAERICLNGPNHLPTFTDATSARIRCTALSADAKPDASEDIRHLSASVAIRESAILTPSGKKPPPLRQRSARKRRLADAFLNVADENFSEPIPLVIPSDTSDLGPPLISLGPNTDAVLDRFDLGDKLLPRLHVFVRTVRSSRWEAALRTAPWSLTFEQAANLSRALLADLQGTPVFSTTAVFIFPTWISAKC